MAACSYLPYVASAEREYNSKGRPTMNILIEIALDKIIYCPADNL